MMPVPHQGADLVHSCIILLLVSVEFVVEVVPHCLLLWVQSPLSTKEVALCDE